MRNPLAKTLIVVGVLIVVGSAAGAIAKRTMAHNELERLLSKETPLEKELVVQQDKYEPAEKEADRLLALIESKAEIVETDAFVAKALELSRRRRPCSLTCSRPQATFRPCEAAFATLDM